MRTRTRRNAGSRTWSRRARFGLRTGRAQKLIAGIYSRAAHRFYDPLVVHGSFKLLSGGRLHDLVAEQGRRAVSVANGGPILDVPVGTAYFTKAVARAHPGLVVGVDIAEGMVQESRAVARREGLSNLSVVQSSVHEMPFPDGTFRAILCTNGLQVMPDLEAAVTELARVLAPGGTLFVSVVGVPLRSKRLPTAFATKNVIGALNGAGLNVTARTVRRLMVLYESRGGAPASSSSSPRPFQAEKYRTRHKAGASERWTQRRLDRGVPRRR